MQFKYYLHAVTIQDLNVTGVLYIIMYISF